jgi:hypothetical protein
MEIDVDNDGNTRRFLFATSKVPRFVAGVLQPNSGIQSVEESPYYWWFRYLKLAGRAACGLHGLATEPPDQPGTATRLCYPSTLSFSEWWHLHVHLFAEPAGTASVRVARAADEVAPIGHTNEINLVIPLDWPISAIMALTKSVVQQEQSERNIEGIAEFKAPARSQAAYRLSEKWNVTGLEHAFAVYKAREDMYFEVADDKSITWFAVGLRSGIPAARNMGPGERDEHDFQRRKSLEDIARRHYGRAKEYLKASFTTQFP